MSLFLDTPHRTIESAHILRGHFDFHTGQFNHMLRTLTHFFSPLFAFHALIRSKMKKKTFNELAQRSNYEPRVNIGKSSIKKVQ